MGKIAMEIRKIKTTSVLAAAYDHNMRFRFCDNADKTRLDENKVVVDRGMSYTDFLNQRLQETERYKGKKASSIRKDATRMVDIRISVNKDEVKNNPKFTVEGFCKRAEAWAEKTFGEKNIAGMVYHGDESAPHIHLLVVPMTEDDRLCWKDIGGLPALLRNMQTTIAQEMEPLGLERGARRSAAKSHDIKEFYAELQASLDNTPPCPEQDESLAAYALRVQEERKRREATVFKEKLDLQQKMTGLKTTINQQRDALRGREDSVAAGLLAKNDKLQQRIQELEGQIKTKEKANETLRKDASLMADVAYAIKSGAYPKDKADTLLRLLGEAQKAGQEAKIERGSVDQNKQK